MFFLSRLLVSTIEGYRELPRRHKTKANRTLKQLSMA